MSMTPTRIAGFSAIADSNSGLLVSAGGLADMADPVNVPGTSDQYKTGGGNCLHLF